MRILYLITRSEEGGARTHVSQLCKYFNAKGDSVAVMSYPGGWLEKEVEKIGVQFYANHFFSNNLNPIKLISAVLKINNLVKEFKPDQTIFKLLDSVYPGNKVLFISYLDKLSQNLDENFVFIMLIRYIRNLIIIKEGAVPPKMQSWQTYKLKSQALHWKQENLVNFYQALFKIEIGLKTSSNPFSVKESLEILACHFL